MIFQVQAATGEEVSAEDLGGADLHCRLVNWRVKGEGGGERATCAGERGGGRREGNLEREGGGERATSALIDKRVKFQN